MRKRNSSKSRLTQTKVQFLESQLQKKYPSLYNSLGGNYILEILKELYGHSKRNLQQRSITSKRNMITT